MDRTQAGRAMMIAGALLLLAGIIGIATGGGNDHDAAIPSSVTTSTTTTTTTLRTTTTAAATTTTVDTNTAVAAFITQFAVDIANSDTSSLMATLNPTVLLASGEQLCRDFVNREILAISNYQLLGPIEGPVSKAIDTVAGNVTVDNIYGADVSFDFGGQSFPSKADFVMGPDGVVSWLATCR